ncbi:MAG: hypothetical protein ISQ55_06265 [Pseudomonadales bacterium]|jgi:hypothetical protein|nr:hypothetical protein [Pseudomonadales bacterium]
MEQAAERGAEALASFLAQWPEYREVLAPAGRPEGTRSVHRAYVLGTIKSGKSTLINALLGREVMTRGAGVKTFNQIHSLHGEALAAEVQLWPSSVLEARLAFDFRLLGAPQVVPAQVYEASTLAVLEAARAQFEAESEADGRLKTLEAGSAYGLLHHALTRLRLTLAGLSSLQARGFRPEPPEAPQLHFEEAGFSDFLAWTDEASLAPLIAHLSLRLPFPEGLPRSLSLIDCQGSDSLNPLDAADVQAIGQRADTVLYVVQSRLGLREGDRVLLRQLAAQGLAKRLLAVLNVEAFEPLTDEAFQRLRTQVEADLAGCLGQPIPLFAVDALRGLEGRETAEMVEGLWARRGAEAVAQAVGTGLAALQATLRTRCRETLVPAAANAFDVERAVLSALLARDEAVLGLSAEGLAPEQQRRGVKRAFEGARRELRAALAHRIEETFSPQGAMAQELDAFLRGGLERYLAERPMPEALAEQDLGPAIIDEALERFNQDWLHERAAVREQELQRLRQALMESLEGGAEELGRELQALLPRALQPSLAARFTPAALREGLGKALALTPAPTVLEPLSLSRPRRLALLAAHHGRTWWEKLRRQPVQQAERNRAQWRLALKAALKDGQEARRHGLLNARENYKHRFAYQLLTGLFEALEHDVLAALAAHEARLASLADAQKLLLPHDARQAAEALLRTLEATAER